ncbi:hypothetical protein PYW07_016437 [Mythimna separata]|uniref:HTH CENPB-type domain-containing protein n=1 Tax=Mythimna separata TaxID=271217 RepID=A0AAD7YLN2_MYTSE|nr:hypothetical protein PYW07_016437 [Mythimna separata]
MTAVTGKHMTIRAAEKRYRIPHTTLWQHLKSGSTVKQTGRKLVFNTEQEKELVKRIQNLRKTGISVTPKVIRKEAFEYCLENNIKNTFNITKGLAGMDWYYGFIKRHSEMNP